MRNLAILLLIGLSLAACGGEATPTFASPADALTQGKAAASAHDTVVAQAAYDFVLNSDASAEMKFKAACGAFELAPTVASFEGLKANHASSLNASSIRKLADACINAREIDAGNAVLEYGMATFPNESSLFEKAMVAMEALQADPGADLSGLGYAGD